MATPNTDQLMNDARCIDKCIPDGEKMSVLVSVLYQLLQNGTGGGGGFSTGMIIEWYGSIASIPSGWHLCNGASGTPDLRNRFISGADADVGGVAKTTITGSALQSGGSTSHSHTITDHGHTHQGNSGSNPNGLGIANVDTGGVLAQGAEYGAANIGPGSSGYITPIVGSTESATTGISVDSTTTVPPFYALAYIMKL